MDLLSLILFGSLNLLMAVLYLTRKDQYQYPFWAAVIALGWFFPQVLSLYPKRSILPVGAYSSGMFFAAVCTAALWFGYVQGYKKNSLEPSWLDAEFDISKLYYAGAFLSVFGFFFYWKLMNLPEEMLSLTQWTGAPVKYLFFSNVFKFGFITLWLIYLSQRKWVAPKLLIFIIPSLLLISKIAILSGRRAAMMDLVSYTLVGLWFARRYIPPRILLLSGLVLGLVLVNSIGLYRGIMMDGDASLQVKLSEAASADYLEAAKSESLTREAELRNYLYFRQVSAEEGIYDYGAAHWNLLIFNYVPAQIVGRSLKDSLMLPLKDMGGIVQQKYGYTPSTGAVFTGYYDAFASFGWIGFVKFILVGYIMGVLYRHAMQGAFLGQLLYVYCLQCAMQVISHQTNDIIIRIWIYFFVLGYFPLYLARVKKNTAQVIA